MNKEDALIRDVLAGNAEAFGILVARYQRPIYNLMRRTTGSPETAADLAQDTFLRAYANLERFRPGARFFPWLYAIGLNRAKDWLRAAGRHRETELEDPSNHVWSSEKDPHERLEAHLDLERVRRAVDALPLGYREAVMLRYHEDLPLSQVAEALGIGLSAAKMRVHRALDMMRRCLEEESDE